MKNIIFGIQGGIGSFNEEALHDYTKRHKINNYKTKYLYTTQKVLENLHRGDVDYGLFATHNSVGGIVQETIHAIAKFKFTIVEEYAILIRHFLMKRKDVDEKEITTIMAHPQVFRQCQGTLAKQYSDYELKSGKGDLIDTAKAAKALSQGKVAKNTAILGPKSLSKLYDLEIVDENLQDNEDNLTSFLMVER